MTSGESRVHVCFWILPNRKTDCHLILRPFARVCVASFGVQALRCGPGEPLVLAKPVLSRQVLLVLLLVPIQ
jgi:hypothetical protein